MKNKSIFQLCDCEFVCAGVAVRTISIEKV